MSKKPSKKPEPAHAPTKEAALPASKVGQSSLATPPLTPLFDKLEKAGFEIELLSHAEAILRHDMGEAAAEIEEILLALEIPDEELVRGGGGEADATQRTRKAFHDAGWMKHEFTVQRIIDGVKKASVSHIVDHVKKFGDSTVALEIEWNNKDPFFDRDLENFKRLHADGAISVGCVVTRGRTLHEGMDGLIEAFARRKNIASIADVAEYYTPTPRQIKKIEKSADRFKSFPKGWAAAFCGDKFGEATTHWGKLQDRVSRGVGNPCPLLLIGIPASVVKAV